MSDYTLLITKTEELGRVTRDFAASLREYERNVRQVSENLRQGADNCGWDGELYQQFLESLSSRLGDLNNTANQMVRVSETLDAAADGYDQYIAALKKAIEKGK